MSPWVHCMALWHGPCGPAYLLLDLGQAVSWPGWLGETTSPDPAWQDTIQFYHFECPDMPWVSHCISYPEQPPPKCQESTFVLLLPFNEEIKIVMKDKYSKWILHVLYSRMSCKSLTKFVVKWQPVFAWYTMLVIILCFVSEVVMFVSWGWAWQCSKTGPHFSILAIFLNFG